MFLGTRRNYNGVKTEEISEPEINYLELLLQTKVTDVSLCSSFSYHLFLPF